MLNLSIKLTINYKITRSCININYFNRNCIICLKIRLLIRLLICLLIRILIHILIHIFLIS